MWINPDFPNVFYGEHTFGDREVAYLNGWTLTTFIEKVLPETETEL